MVSGFWISTIIFLVVIAIGSPFIYSVYRKDKKKNLEIEKKCMEYIFKHRQEYSKDGISQALLQTGVSPEDCKKYIEKYY